MITLALAYLRDRPLTTALNVLLLAISVAMLVLMLQLGTQAREGFDRDARRIDLVGPSIEGIRIFAWLLAATGGLAILVALVGMVRSREGDLALLRVMGARRAQVFGTLMLEGVITALFGALAGWAGAHALIMVARASFPTIAELGFSPWHLLPAEVALVAGVIGIGACPSVAHQNLDPARVLARGN